MVENRVAGIAILVLILWAWYRFTTNTAYSLYSISGICYVDIISIACVSILLLRFLPKRQTVTEHVNCGFCKDEPILNSEGDRFNRDINARDAAEKLIHTDTTDSAFTFGIVAPWGEGKTSFMNLMKEHLESKYKEELIIMDFNPWIYRKCTNLTQVFFDELSNKLSVFSSGLSRNIRIYAESLNVIDNTWVKFLTHSFIKRTDKSTSDLFLELANNIKSVQKKIVVFIDDIDRLGSNELEEIFRLVRNTSNLPNMYFVVAYDKIYVVDTIRLLYANHSLLYTEKILQEEYVLPKITKEQIADELEGSLRDVFGDRGDLFDKLLNAKFDVYQFIKNQRDVKRYGNILHSHFNQLKDDIEIFDLCVFELLRLRYPYVMQFIADNKDCLFDIGNYRNKKLFEETEETKKQEVDKLTYLLFYKKKIDLRKYLQDNKELLHLKSEDLSLIDNLLDVLWGKYRRAEIGQINHQSYFDRYFYYTVLENEIPEKDIQQFLKLSFDDMKSSLKEWSVNKSNFFIHRMEGLIQNDESEFLKLIKIMFYFNSVTSKMSFDNDYITKQIREIPKNDGNRKVYSEEDRIFVRKLMEMEECEKYAIIYIHYLHYQRRVKDFPLSSEELSEIQKSLFLKFTQSQSRDLFDIISIYRYTNLSDKSKSEEATYHPAVREEIQRICKERFDEFISYSVYKVNSFDEDILTLSFITEIVWGSFEDYCNYVRSRTDQSEILDEYKDFIQKLEESGFKVGITYEFKKLRLREVIFKE
ncbi:MAG: KAP family P-loop NTPase fold protein [Bacteroidales bacterium]